MNKPTKLMLPVAVATAGFLGVSGASLLNSFGADAASTTGTSSTSTNSTGTGSGSSSSAPQGPHVANGITETVLTGDTLSKATAAAQKAEPGTTVVRAETDADGAKY